MVRLPVDWLGPREELVPFGPSAEKRARDSGASNPPLRAEDFWGESSADIHHALEPSVPLSSRRSPAPSAPTPAPSPSWSGPSASFPVPPAASPAPSAHAPSRVRRGRLHRIRPGVGLSFERIHVSRAVRWSEARLWLIGAYVGRLRLPLRERRTLLAVSSTVLAAALFTFVELNSVAGVAHRSPLRSGRLITELFRPPTESALARVGQSVAVRSAPARTMAQVPRVPHHSEPRPRPHIVEVKATTPTATPAASHASSVQYTSGTSQSQASAPSSSATAGSSESAVNGSAARPSSSTSSRAAATPAQSGPVGPGAPFGPGHLG